MNDEKKNTESIDVRLIISAILKHRKSILVVAVIFAVIFPVFKYVMDPPKNDAEEATNTVVSEETKVEDTPEIAAYKNELDVLTSNKQYLEDYISDMEDQYAGLLQKKESRDQYKSRSVLLNIDPYNVAKEIRTYRVGSAYTVDDITADMIVSAYAKAATAANEDINEYLSISDSSNASYISLCDVSTDGDTITLNVTAPDKMTADTFIKNASDAIDNAEKTIKSEYGEHSITLTSARSFTAAYDVLRTAQENYDNSIVSSVNSTKDKLVSLKGNLASINTQIRNAEAGLRSALSSTDTTGSDTGAVQQERKGTTRKDLIIWAILGFVLGTILMSMYHGMRFLLTDTLKYEGEIFERYGIRVLSPSNDRENGSVIPAIIEKLVSDDKNLLIASTQGDTACRPFENALKEGAPGINIEVVGDLSANAEGIRKLGRSKNILLVEGIDRSEKKAISNEIEIIRLAGAEIIGCITY